MVKCGLGKLNSCYFSYDVETNRYIRRGSDRCLAFLRVVSCKLQLRVVQDICQTLHSSRGSNEFGVAAKEEVPDHLEVAMLSYPAKP